MNRAEITPAKMNPERWRVIKTLLDSALELKAEDRRAFLDRACAGDEAMRREVDSFIATDEQASYFMDKPAFEDAARMLAEEQSVRETQVIDRVATDERSHGATTLIDDGQNFMLAPDAILNERYLRRDDGSPPPAFRLPQVASAPRQPKARPPLWALLIVMLIALLAVAAVGTIDWPRLSPRSDTASAPPDTKPPAVPERSLSYSLLALRNPKRNPGGQLFATRGAIIFREGDQVRLNVSSPQAGYLYVINEGPELTGAPPEFVVMFPNAGGSAQIEADQTIQIPAPSGNPEADWFVFNEEVGVEKIWLIWSERSVAEMEEIKRWANPKDKGLVGDPSRIERVAMYLKALAAAEIEVEMDEANQRTILKGKGEVLAGVVRLEHR